jgi:uncharacterized membrane protein
MINFIRFHWRLFAAVCIGLAAGFVAAAGDRFLGAPMLVGWNARAEAGRQDEGRLTLTVLILSAVAVSLAAALYALRETKALSQAHPDERTLVLMLSATTLVVSWLTVQSLFVLHYAHRYFGDSDRDGKNDGGVTFPGEPPRSYRDFIYVAICVGATCQVSDFSITTARYRNLVTAHAIFAFCFNTMILALGINIIAGLMGQ